MEIAKRFTFEAAHRLENVQWSPEKNFEIFGKCYNLHGHSYKLYVTVDGEVNLDDGMVINFGTLKQYVQNSIIELFDHSYLNDLPQFSGIITTAENIIQIILQILQEDWPFSGVKITEIKLYETENSYAIWSDR